MDEMILAKTKSSHISAYEYRCIRCGDVLYTRVDVGSGSNVGSYACATMGGGFMTFLSSHSQHHSTFSPDLVGDAHKLARPYSSRGGTSTASTINGIAKWNPTAFWGTILGAERAQAR